VSNDAKGSAYYAQGNHDRPSLKLLGAARLAEWPTPVSNDSVRASNTYPRGNLTSVGAARLTGWATPAAHEAGGTPEQFLKRKRKANANGSSLGVSLTSLSLQATLSSWATPAARDHRSDRGRKSDSEQYGSKGRPLPRQALLLDSGPKRTGGSAATAKLAQLNPAHSRWLIGYPSAWDETAPWKPSRGSGASKRTEMPLSRKSQRRSSAR